MATTNALTTFVCLFHNAARGRDALSALEEAGVPAANLRTVSTQDATHGSSLAELGVPEKDLKHFEHGIRDGGVAISFEAPEASSDVIESIFHRYKAGKIDDVEIETAPEAVAVGNLRPLGDTRVPAAAAPATSRKANSEIELVETAEVPVVNKVARVVEEVYVGKVETEHTEVVHDSVRHTEVAFENLDGARSRRSER